MAIYLYTSDPESLFRSIKSYISMGKISTWTYDESDDLTINRPQWIYKAWMRAAVVNDDKDNKALVFGIVSSNKYPMTATLYGIYHGRLAATLLTHFDSAIDDIRITPLARPGVDII